MNYRLPQCTVSLVGIDLTIGHHPRHSVILDGIKPSINPLVKKHKKGNDRFRLLPGNRNKAVAIPLFQPNKYHKGTADTQRST